MKPSLEYYTGREQSYIKHLFLTKYLESAAYKLFQGRSPVFNYVDAFSGPWRHADTDSLSDTSFSLALNTLENVRRILNNLGRPGLKVRFRFCERNPDSVDKLRAFASQRIDFDIQVFAGEFEDNLASIKAACLDIPSSFTFTFIDPTGWDVDSTKIFALLKELRGEVLINFMSEHVNRHAGWERVSASVGRFLADPDWRSSFESVTEGTNEEKILKLFKAKARAAGVAVYLPDIAIQKPREDRIKMRLILGTRSGQGVEVFRTVQEAIEKEAIRTRYGIKAQESGQPSLFSDEQLVDLEASKSGVGCPSNIEKAKDLFLILVKHQPGDQFDKLAYEVIEQIPVRKTHMNKIALDLKRAGLIQFELPARKRTPTPETRIYSNL